jgi:hypothetical protein
MKIKKKPPYNAYTIKAQFKWTSACFKRVLIEHFYDDLTTDQRKLPLDELKLLISLGLHEPTNTPEIDELYIKEVLKLNTTKLSIIVDVYSRGLQSRNPATIERITTELFERAINSETN